MNRMYTILFVFGLFLTDCDVSDHTNTLPHECYDDKETLQEVTIEEMVLNGRREVVEKTTNAGTGVVIGAVGTGLAAVATGGVAPAIAAMGGGAVGGLAGSTSGTTTTHTSTDCAFRVTMEGIPLVYSGKADDDDAPYKKCLMLHPGDKIQVQITQHCNKASRINRLWSKVYKWVSGPTKGELL